MANNPMQNIYSTLSAAVTKSPAFKKVLDVIYPLTEPFIYKMNTFPVSTADFLHLQQKDGLFVRPDMIIRYLFLEQHYGQHNSGIDAISLYKKMQDFRLKSINSDGEKATAKFYRLIDSYEKNGYDPSSIVEADRNMFIRDGSHRTAMALFLNLPEINIHYSDKELPLEHKLGMFEDNGFTDEEKQLVAEKTAQLLDRYNKPLSIVLWNNAADCAQQICQDLETYGTVTDFYEGTYSKKDYTAMAKQLFKVQDIAFKEDVSSEENHIAVISLKLSKPSYRGLKNPKCPVLRQSSEIKKLISQKYGGDKAASVPLNFGQNTAFMDITGTYIKETASV